MDSDWSTPWTMSQSTLATVYTTNTTDSEVTLAPGRHIRTGPCTLKMSPDSLHNTKFTSNDGVNEYSVTTRSQNAGTLSACSRTDVLDGNGKRVGAFTKPMAAGAEMVMLGDQPPIKRKSWMSTGGVFSGDTVGKFHHAEKDYKWIKVVNKDDGAAGKRAPVLELYSAADGDPIARFTPSRRDTTAPSNQLVIIDAALEIRRTDSQTVTDLIVFSFVLAEFYRRDAMGDVAKSIMAADGAVRSARGW